MTKTHDVNVNGERLGPNMDTDFMTNHPRGLRKLLKWVDKRYNKPKVYVFENG